MSNVFRSFTSARASRLLRAEQLAAIADARLKVESLLGGIRHLAENADQIDLAARREFADRAESGLAAILRLFDHFEREV